MAYINKELSLAIGGLAILSGLAVYSKIEDSKKTKNSEIAKEITILNWQTEDTTKKYEKDSILEEKLIKFTHYQ